MIASLPMYARPELADAHDRFWTLIKSELARAGLASPAQLSQTADEQSAWRDDELVLSQTCGMPYRNGLHGQVALIGTPDYRLGGCEPGYGRSAFVVRVDDGRQTVREFRDARFAFNQEHSESGFSSPYHHVVELGFWFEGRLRTGQHVASARAVADGTADIASIDAVTWRLIERHDSWAAKLRVIDWTAPVPWLPYITRLDGPVSAMFDAISAAIDGLSEADRDALGIFGLVRVPAAAYLAVRNPPATVLGQIDLN